MNLIKPYGNKISNMDQDGVIKMNSLWPTSLPWKNCSRVTNLDRYFREVVRVS